MTDNDPRALKAALWYAAKGWPTVPVSITQAHPKAKKRVEFRLAWNEAATTDPSQLHDYFGPAAERVHARQGVAIVTGKKSDLWVVDVDNEYAWDMFMTELGVEPPKTYTVKSQSGSTHYYFRWPENLKGSGQGTLLPKSWDEYREAYGGVDIRGNGGLIFAPPTEVFHPDGSVVGQYHLVDPEAEVAQAPDWLVEFYNKSSGGGSRGGASSERAARPKVAEFPLKDWNHKEADRVRDALLEEARSRFEYLIHDPESQWDNGVTSVMGFLVRLVNSPWAEFTEDDLDEFLDKHAPEDQGFTEDDHMRIKNSCFRMADGEILDFDDHDPEEIAQIDRLIKEAHSSDTVKQAQEEAAAPLANIPQEFWDARPLFGSIQRAAHARGVGADAAFHSFLAAYTARVPFQYQIDSGLISPANITHFAALVGPSGAGKGSSVKRGLYLAQNDLPELPLGTGEGITQYFLENRVDESNPDNYKDDGTVVGNPTKVNVQVRHNMLINETEGSAMSVLMGRNGATMESILLKLAMGESLGQLNATEGSNRLVPEGSYSVGFVAGFQETVSAELLSKTDTGLAQRFMWSAVTDVHLPHPDVPMATEPLPLQYAEPLQPRTEDPVQIWVAETITRPMKEYNYAVKTGKVQPDPHESHRPVRMLQIAALLRLLEGPNAPGGYGYIITQEDWDLAQILFDTSSRVRRQLLAKVNIVRNSNEEERGRLDAVRRHAAQVETEKINYSDIREKILGVIEIVKEKGENATEGRIIRGITRSKKPLVPDALAEMVEDGTLILADGKYAIAAPTEA